MREHMGLFRGKWIDKWHYGKWVEGNLEIYEEKPFIHINVDNPYAIHRAEVDPETVGECTGLRDKNGKLIFEGDIVSGRDFDEEDGFGVVEWYDGAYEVGNGEWCGTFHSNYNSYEFEIIGNVHDNPELLKGGEANGD